MKGAFYNIPIYYHKKLKSHLKIISTEKCFLIKVDVSNGTNIEYKENKFLFFVKYIINVN